MTENNNKPYPFKDYRKMTHRRYHKDVYFPEECYELIVDFFNQFDHIYYSNHAEIEMASDKFCRIPKITIPDIKNSNNHFIEYYEPTVHGRPQGYIQKALIRVTHLSDKYDYSYMIAREGEVVTAWANLKEDFHRLTNDNSYYVPYHLKAI